VHGNSAAIVRDHRLAAAMDAGCLAPVPLSDRAGDGGHPAGREPCPRDELQRDIGQRVQLCVDVEAKPLRANRLPISICVGCAISGGVGRSARFTST